ncbi:hypothetical protein [Halorhabdus rudnickae]|uniref:hypothetical protein n=1 Tax=Halorhabdus rudnickae TaxID=1775544 RepID=UPI00108430C4|nr:hypothetical protein [Halorhabdus rudnickae]
MEQTALEDFGKMALTDGGQAEEQHFDPSGDSATVSDAWEGTFIYTSWGYGQTNVNLAQITEVSGTGKTVKARMVKGERVSVEEGSESVRPTAEQYGDEFRLQVRDSGGDPVFRGSYPYVDGDKDNGTRRDSFFPWDNKAGNTVHQTAPNYGH